MCLMGPMRVRSTYLLKEMVRDKLSIFQTIACQDDDKNLYACSPIEEDKCEYSVLNCMCLWCRPVLTHMH